MQMGCRRRYNYKFSYSAYEEQVTHLDQKKMIVVENGESILHYQKLKG